MYDEALEQANRALELWKRALGNEHPNVVAARMGVAEALLGLGRAKEAVAQYVIAVDVATRSAGADNPLTAEALLGRAAALLSLGSLAPALADAERAVAIRRLALGARHPGVAEALLLDGSIRARQGHAPDAVAVLSDARAILDAQVAPPAMRAEVSDALARAIWESTRDREQTRKYALDARDAYALAGPGEAARARSLETLLASLDGQLTGGAH